VACDDDDGDGLDGTSTPSGIETQTQEPTGGTASPDTSPTEDGGSAQIPTNAEDYAKAAIEAWTGGDDDMLDELAADEAVSALDENGGAAEDWTLTVCDGATGQVSCEFSSGNGETLTLLIDNALASAGAPEAVIDARFA
jgi:hypothetical protein